MAGPEVVVGDAGYRKGWNDGRDFVVDGLLCRRIGYVQLSVQDHVFRRHLVFHGASEFVEGVVGRLRYLALVRLPVSFCQQVVADSLGRVDEGFSIAVDVCDCCLEGLGNFVVVAVSVLEGLGPWGSARRPSDLPA